METKNCVICGNKATSWCGHVHTDIGSIIAGRCDNCERLKSPFKRSQNCTYINPHSCYGDRDINALELREPITSESLMRHAMSEEFSKRIDTQLRARGEGIRSSIYNENHAINYNPLLLFMAFVAFLCIAIIICNG